jgi:hypothetical protein
MGTVGAVIEKPGADRTDLRHSRAPVEVALRWLATRRRAEPLGLLVDAIKKPESVSAAQLEALVAPTESVPGGSPETRAMAVWGLIMSLIDNIGSSPESRRRNTLIAAFRLPPRPEIAAPWKSSLGDRFRQLMALPGVFGDPKPTTTTPMHKAWQRALTDDLVPALRERLEALAADGPGWVRYVEVARAAGTTLAREGSATTSAATAGYRPPSKGAQPLFLELFVTTVFMRGRTAYRRITERVVTAREDDVGGYTAKALIGAKAKAEIGATRDLTDIPVRALIGCRAEPVVASRPGEPVHTWLRFPRPLRRGDKHYFSSEAIDEDLTEERLWINVEVDHHGIAPGRVLYGCVPIGGLTIRVRFDEECLPEAVWSYAEQTERERHVRPPDGDPRLLSITDGTVQHTFPEKCHPRENYGVSFLWRIP